RPIRRQVVGDSSAPRADRPISAQAQECSRSRQTAFDRRIGRKVMDVWADSVEHRGGRQSLFRDQYNALGKLNLAAIQRIVSAKYQRGAAFNRQHPFVEVLFSDITESGEVLDLTELVREPAAGIS